ncbi:MAG: hypothetical protein JJT89_10440 [Nitriliruptoraceae bacterium]|nr:hypothetical protein [Nitriliruptoraceae bacterium]
MRWTAATLATLVAVLELVLFAVAERQVQQTLAAIAPSAQVPWLRWVWVVAYATPWLVGAALMVADRTRRGVAVLVTAGALLLATSLRGLTDVVDPAGVVGAGPAASAAPTDLTGWLASYGAGLVWLVALGAVVSALIARPRERWSEGAPGPAGPYVTVAVLAWLPVAFQTTAFAPPGTSRAFAETEAAALSGVASVSSVATAIVVAVVLMVACRLRAEVAGLVVLTYAVPTLFAELGSVLQVRTQEFVIFTPPGVLGLIGIVGLLVVGVRWAARPAATQGASR